jgi:NADH dehydrogenase/NADH:ubiquinone oxidoreductase subunit G
VTLHVMVDGHTVEVPDGASALDAVLAAGAFIPHLCKDPDRPRLGTCRTCLVHIDGMRGTPASCTTPAFEGMVIRTDDPEAKRIRAGVLQLTLDMLGETDVGRLAELTEAARYEGVEPGSFAPAPYPDERDWVDDSNVFWVLDHHRCILCQRCTDACQQVQQIGAIAVLDRDGQTHIGTFGHGLVGDSNCTSCGQCWATCPTSAIRLKEPVSAGAAAGWPIDDRRRRRREEAPR